MHWFHHFSGNANAFANSWKPQRRLNRLPCHNPEHSQHPKTQPYALGISLEANSYGSRAFADIFKIDARVWVPGTMDPGPVDKQGMPISDFDLFTLDGNYIRETSGFNGTYTLYFTGLADIERRAGHSKIRITMPRAT